MHSMWSHELFLPCYSPLFCLFFSPQMPLPSSAHKGGWASVGDREAISRQDLCSPLSPTCSMLL